MSHRDTDTAARTAMLVAAVIIAHQVAAKATRDTLFLFQFSADVLYLLKIAAPVVAIVMVVFTSRAMASRGPAGVVPVGFVASGMLHLAEWALWFHTPRTVAVLVYLHFAALSAMLISGFWSLVNERFDPHTARRRVAQIARTGTLGALIGGGMAWAVRSTPMMLPALGAMHLLCGCLLRWMGSHAAGPLPAPPPVAGGLRAGARMLRVHAYLRHMALFVVIGAGCAAMIDIVFMNGAQNRIREDRQRFFALFHAAASVATLGVQIGGTRWLLEKSGLGLTAGTHPAAITLGSLGAALAPGIAGIVVARGSEQVAHNSLFRSAYELFYTPLPPEEKRCIKPLIDVGVERLGDMSGGILAGCLKALNAGMAPQMMLAVAACGGIAGMSVARRLNRGYIEALERSLRNQALQLNLEDITDQTTRATLIRTMAGLPARAGPLQERRTEAPPAAFDPLLRRSIDLRSGDPARVCRALSEAPFDSKLAAEAIVLLGWDEVAEHAAQGLRRAGPSIAPQLVNALLDENTEFAVRRRIPKVLGAFPTPDALDGLLSGLSDKRFEVRYRCGRSVLVMLDGHSGLAVSQERIIRAVLRELEVDRHLWESHRLLDPGEEDQLVGERAHRGLQHVFTLLSLILPKEPLRICFCALHTRDEMLRGTALEYLESALPAAIRDQLWPLLEDKRPKDRAPRSHDEVLAALLESHESIQANLQEIKARTPHQA